MLHSCPIRHSIEKHSDNTGNERFLINRAACTSTTSDKCIECEARQFANGNYYYYYHYV